MKTTILIDGVLIEYYGGRWVASCSGISSNRCFTPMLAYIAYLKAEADQTVSDLVECFLSVQSDLFKMEAEQ